MSSKKVFEICEVCENLIDHRITLQVVGYLYNDDNYKVVYYETVCPACMFKKSAECKEWVSV